MNWQAIPASEFRHGDHRPAGGFSGDIDVVAGAVGATIECYEDCGLGPARVIYLRSTDDTMAYIQTHEYSPKPNFVTIFLDQRCLRRREHLRQVASFLGLGELEWISPDIE